MTSCKDHICFSKQFFFQGTKFWRCKFKTGKLIHTIVNYRFRFKMPAEPQRHRRVIPEEIFRNIHLFKKDRKLIFLAFEHLFMRLAIFEMRDNNPQVIKWFVDLKMIFFCAEYRFFNKEYPEMF